MARLFKCHLILLWLLPCSFLLPSVFVFLSGSHNPPPPHTHTHTHTHTSSRTVCQISTEMKALHFTSITISQMAVTQAVVGRLHREISGHRPFYPFTLQPQVHCTTITVENCIANLEDWTEHMPLTLMIAPPAAKGMLVPFFCLFFFFMRKKKWFGCFMTKMTEPL